MKSVITTALLCAAAVSVNAAWDGSKLTNTSDMTYEYSGPTTTALLNGNGGLNYHQSSGPAVENKYSALQNVSIDLTQNARYEIQFRVRFDGTVSNGVSSYANLYLTDQGGQANILFGNTNSTVCQIGAITGKNVITSPQHESLQAGSCGTNVFSTNWGGGVTSGIYTYKLVFETFESNDIADKIYYSVTKDGGGEGSLKVDLNIGNFGFGSPNDKIFDKVGFFVKGSAYNTDTTTADGTMGVTLITDQNSTSFTKYTRTDTPVPSVPEPSAFGLLAGLGAIALAVSRRRRSR